jgi:hypothetical protein
VWKGVEEMSIYIKGMEMPKGCFECPFKHRGFNGSETVHYCYAICKEVSDDGDIDADCPLIPVPPHGDLIDRDALPWEKQGLMLTDPDEWGLKAWDIEHAPTIIPAGEEGE